MSASPEQLPEPCFELFDYIDRHATPEYGIEVSLLPKYLCHRDVLLAAYQEYENPSWTPEQERYAGGQNIKTHRLCELGTVFPDGKQLWDCYHPDTLEAVRHRNPRVRLTLHGRTALADWRLKRRVGDSGARNPNLRPTQLVDPIPVVKVVEVVGHRAGRSDKLQLKMKRRNYPLEKIANKWYCQRADAIAMFPRYRQRIEGI